MPLRLDDYFEENEEDRRRDGVPEEEPQAEPEQEREKPSAPAADDYQRDFITPDSRRRRRRRFKWALLVVLAVVVFVFVRNLFFAPAAENGVVRGYVVQFEKSGIFFDSYEGILVIDSPDSTRTMEFSLTDQQLGRRMWHAMKTDSVLVLDYERYRSSLPWRGESATLVTGLETARPTSVSTPKPPVRPSKKTAKSK